MIGRRKLFVVIFFLLLCLSGAKNPPKGDNSSALSPALPPTSAEPTLTPATQKYNPRDSFLIACGAGEDVILSDGRTFKSDPSMTTLLNTNEDVKANADSNKEITGLPLFLSARIFPDEATYRFPISQTGFHLVRLYFYPLSHPLYNLTTAVFRVTADKFVFLHDFSVSSPNPIFKEYLLNITSETFTLNFLSKKNSFAFVNAIEVISVPDNLISDVASSVSPSGDSTGISTHALEVLYRVNVGGPLVSPMNDTLWRTWVPDKSFNTFTQGVNNVSTSPHQIKYPDGGATPFIAPPWVYASAAEMANSNTTEPPNFNMTWRMSVDPSYDYLIRLHFCDIVSTALNDLYLNVYVNGLLGVSGLDLTSLTTFLSTAYYRDFVVNSTAITNGSVVIQVGPASGSLSAILNGMEVIKMSNSIGSLNGLFNVDGNYMGAGQRSRTMRIVAIVGLVIGLTAMLLVGSMFIKWHKRPQGWERHNSFSSWLLPLTSSHTSFMSNKNSTTSVRKTFTLFGSRKSSIVPSTNKGVGRFFSFNELQEATNNFNDGEEIGVGGFGKVYLGELDDGTKVAVKRGNPQSEQGINEFQTEIQMLSQLRHRHLVSLIGYCDEGSEMCLVYEYMSNGVLREHLYGSKLKVPLTWKQRLEICIGSARGLHYLHTGAAHCIIHRDVKTTNILLDENLVAKVSDFGLSKAACLIEQTHVSTAVKGSFGYLDPEYFRRQQLTEKSDVYSFGVVLLEVLTARPALDPALSREQVNLAEWGMSSHRKGLLHKIIDPNLQGTINDASLKKFVEAAEKCLAEYGVDRPSMGDVLWNLEYALQLQQAPVSKTEDNSVLMVPLQTVPMLVSSEETSLSTDDHNEFAVSLK